MRLKLKSKSIWADPISLTHYFIFFKMHSLHTTIFKFPVFHRCFTYSCKNVAGSMWLLCSTLKRQKARRGLTNDHINIAINGWQNRKSCSLWNQAFSRPCMCTHVFCPLERLTIHFYGPIALWQRKADGHFTVAQRFLGHISKVLQEHLENAAPAPPGISTTVPPNRFPIYKNHTWVHSYHALLRINKEEPITNATWIDSKALGWVKKANFKNVT